MAPQLTVTNGRPARSDAPWMARASNSLPTPLSPVISTGMLEAAARLPMRTTGAIAGAVAIMSSKPIWPAARFFMRTTSVFRFDISSALRIETMIRSGEPA